MVILTAPYGQASNRFIQHIHLDSFCRANGIYFYNHFLADYYDVYPNLQQHCEKTTGKLLLKAFYRFNWKSVAFTEEGKSKIYAGKMLKHNLLFCNGLFFRSFETTAKSRNLYQKIFEPAINREMLKQEWLTKLDEEEKIVAVHIRRGDYKTFQNGVFYYHDDVYMDKMNRMFALLNNHCRFIIFSNDHAINQNLFTEFPYKVYISYGSTVEDHYLMAHCDYIIGPPSTFSLWASYIGETRYYHIYNRNAIPDLNHFTVCPG